MKQDMRKQMRHLIFFFTIALFVSASPVAAQPCGDIIFYTEEYDENDNVVLIEEREEIVDCSNPFNKDEPVPFSHSLQINGEDVSDGETIVIDSEAPVIGQFSITNPPGVIGANSASPNFVLYQATSSDYKEVLKADTSTNFSISSLEPGSYTAVFIFEAPPDQSSSETWWQKLFNSWFGNTAFAFYPNSTQVVTKSFTIEHTPPEPLGASSVLFLPGIKASRLYMEEDGEENQLWNPGNDADVLKLGMNSDGLSVNDVYTNDIIESVWPFEFYKDFISELEELKEDENAIKDYLAFSYDWRYSVFDVATMDIATPNGEYKNLREEVERLAAESYTGKVTLIGHSNGGLVAKALLHEYGDNELAGKVDKIIMIGTPQLGTPQSIGSLLHGYGEALGDGLITTAVATRESIKNMPGAYGLLPTSRYFEMTGNEAVVTTDGSALTAPISTYGDITDSSKLKDFLTDSQNTFPEVEKSNDPLALNENILNSTLHNQNILDNWVPPDGVGVYEVVGTGLPTIKSFDYRSYSCAFASCPGGEYLVPYAITSNIGDSVVVGASAEGFGEDKTTFYIDLFLEGEQFGTFTKNHGSLTESESVQEFVNSVIKYPYLSDTLIASEFSSISTRYTIVSTHSPVTIRASTSNGKVGIFDGQILEEIPGSQYFTLGESTYLILPSAQLYNLEVIGTGEGVFSLVIEQLLEDDTTEELSFLDGATTTPTTVSTFTLNNRDISNIKIDYENDGVVDVVQTPNGEIIPPEPLVPVVYNYDDLENAIVNLSIKKSYKTLLLVQVKLAEKLSKKDNKLSKKLEDIALESLLKSLKAYNKKNIISNAEFSELELIVNGLIN